MDSWRTNFRSYSTTFPRVSCFPSHRSGLALMVREVRYPYWLQRLHIEEWLHTNPHPPHGPSHPIVLGGRRDHGA